MSVTCYFSGEMGTMSNTEIVLTEKEKALIPSYIEKWRKIGLCTDPCDFEKAVPIAKRCYEAAGYPAPEYFHHVRSPIEARDLAMKLKKEGGPIVNGKPAWDKVPANPAECVREQVYGPHDGHWFAYFDLLWEQRREPAIEKLLPLMELATVCGWWSAYDKNCILQDRHSEIHFNDNDQLHNTDGPAVAWRDGTKLWYINGVEVDEQIVMRPETQTLQQITKEENMEIKRIRAERYGWVKYLTGVGAKKIDSRENPIEYTHECLYSTQDSNKPARTRDNDNMGNILLCVCPSTGKDFALEVPPTTRTCEEAQAYLSSGLSKRIISAS